jgi:uncharacterized protein Smg (DUF494 family)
MMGAVTPLRAAALRPAPTRLQIAFGDDQQINHALGMIEALADVLPKLALEKDQDRASLAAVIRAFAQPLVEQLNATRVRPRHRAVND